MFFSSRLAWAISKPWFETPVGFFAGFQEVTQVPNFCRLKFAVTAIWQGSEDQWAKGDSFEFNHFVTNTGK